jgi:hypothetical protein
MNYDKLTSIDEDYKKMEDDPSLIHDDRSMNNSGLNHNFIETKRSYRETCLDLYTMVTNYLYCGLKGR